LQRRRIRHGGRRPQRLLSDVAGALHPRMAKLGECDRAVWPEAPGQTAIPGDDGGVVAAEGALVGVTGWVDEALLEDDDPHASRCPPLVVGTQAIGRETVQRQVRDVRSEHDPVGCLRAGAELQRLEETGWRHGWLRSMFEPGARPN